jgi:hypothetical protein
MSYGAEPGVPSPVIAAQVAMMRRPRPRISTSEQERRYVQAVGRDPRSIADVVRARGGSRREAEEAEAQWRYRGGGNPLAVGRTRRRRSRR